MQKRGFMRIELGQYTVNTDKYKNVWISKSIVSKTGKESDLRLTGYHSNFENCLKDFALTKITGSEAETVSQFLEVAKATIEEITAIVAQVKDVSFKEEGE